MVIFMNVVTCYVTSAVKCVVLRPTFFCYRCFVGYSKGIRACDVRLVMFRVLFCFFINRPTLIKRDRLRFIPMRFNFNEARSEECLQRFGFAGASRVVFCLFLLRFCLLYVERRLPLTTATCAVILTREGNACQERFIGLRYFYFNVFVLFAFSLRICCVAQCCMEGGGRRIICFYCNFSFNDRVHGYCLLR